jgi:hypothetical protein
MQGCPTPYGNEEKISAIRNRGEKVRPIVFIFNTKKNNYENLNN